MNTTQGSLVIVGANTTTPQVFFNGTQVEGVKTVTVANNATVQRVVIGMDEPLQSLVDAGITIKRGV